MKLANVRSVVALLIALTPAADVNFTQAGSPADGMAVIGVVEAKGSFRLDRATITGNATLFEGATIETGRAITSQELRNGARVTLSPDSKGRFYDDHMILERGQGCLDRTTGYFFEARGLTVQPETGSSTGRVVLAVGEGVQVAALTGSLRIFNTKRMLIAKVLPGTALAFSSQAGGYGTSRVTGRLGDKGGHYVLTDETTNVTVEITGAGLKKEEGRRVEVAGSLDPTATPVSGATQVIRVTAITRLPAGTAAAGTSGPVAGGSGGIWGLAISGTTVAVIGGVAAAAIVGGLAAAGSLSSESSPVSR